MTQVNAKHVMSMATRQLQFLSVNSVKLMSDISYASIAIDILRYLFIRYQEVNEE